MTQLRKCTGAMSCWNLRFAYLLLSLSLGCGSSLREPAAPSTLPVAVPCPSTLAGKQDSQPEMTDADPEPAVTPAETLSVRDKEGVRNFLARLCERAARDDGDWIAAHVRMPLVGNVWLADNDGDPLVGHVEANAGALASLAVCFPTVSSPIEVLSIDRGRWDVRVDVNAGGRTYRLLFVGPEAEPRLVEVTWLPPLPSAPASPVKGGARFATRSEVEAAHPLSMGEVIKAFIDDELKRNPACLRQSVARENAGFVLRLRATRRPREDARVPVYAESPVRASLLACVESQVRVPLAATFRGVAFEVDYVLRVSVPGGAAVTNVRGSAVH
jgi:hypothetical protein